MFLTGMDRLDPRPDLVAAGGDRAGAARRCKAPDAPRRPAIRPGPGAAQAAPSGRVARPAEDAGRALVPCRLAAAMVAAATGVSVEDILSRRRAPASAASARQLAMYLAHVGLGVALADVARAFRRDRTTVAYACRRIEDLRDGSFDQEVARIEDCTRWASGA